GLALNGNWKPHQLITAAFLHVGLIHLLSNLLFFFAVAFSLEDLWGRGIFLGFYLLGAAVSCLPDIVHPGVVPSVGASGAISAVAGAFLLRLPKTKIKLLCLHFWWIRLLFGKKPIVVMVPGYIYLGSYYIAQIVLWYLDKKAGYVGRVGYSVHIAGCLFGLSFAGLMKLARIEENYIHPKIEAKISFSAAPAVTQALEAMDRGDTLLAERKLRAHLAKQPDDTNALLAAIQVYERTSNFDQLNAMYGRLIRHHLARDDKEAALYAYDSLLTAFPDDNVAPRIAARDWIVVCDYLRESEMNREAAVEYERLVNACGDDPLALRAAIYGGEAALAANDVDRALRLFQKAGAMNAPEQLGVRARAGIEKCNRILSQRPNWGKKPAAKPAPKLAF
ncbi:MAG TPA: rhomboid family intramembrane serine protease, partial [Blastocatellia bacterium]|nr:rhomboid family intramembrane serine protease [Blastocatellia bacterium]